ncbi:hypothetical protein HU200_054502 [Digitaria exilis]|uniref:VWFA domain-containing protein n=1 Tax=Digitaria exilis TaxID=1010633 RepID=A0A835E468_9POAL|nr:hypothetical protein HU200_054502 [Digitaria exilis]
MKTHAPIDLVTLINISHNMSLPAKSPTEAPSPSRLDLLKKAIKFIARHLDDDDRLAIVAFNDQVIKEYSTELSEMSSSGRMAIEKKVDGLVAKGDTAFKPSLEYAVKLLDERADKQRVGFIVLVSDGLDKQIKWSDESIATTDPIQALLRKYPVHTLGLCKPHDPKALHYIARTSYYGTYSSITDDDHLDTKIIEAFAVFFAGFKTTVAVDTSLDIRSSSLQVTRIDSGGYTLRAASSGAILVGTLYAGEVKDFVVYFSLPHRQLATGLPHDSQRDQRHRHLQVRQQAMSTSTATTTDTCSVSLPVHVADAGSPPANPCPPHPVVLQQTIRFKVVDLLTNVLKEFHLLKEEAAGGGAVHGGEDPVLQAVAASSLHRKWAEFKNSDESWKGAPTSFLNNLGCIDDDVTAMVSVLKKGMGVGCVYSWLSSHQMQRATTAAVTGRFRTPAMVVMVEEAQREIVKEASDKDVGSSAVGRRAVELLDGVNKRFELWCKLDHDLPPARQAASDMEDGELAAALRGDINRAKQHHIYLAADHAIKEWRSFLASVGKTHDHGPAK